MRFLDKLVLRQKSDHKSMINVNTCSMLESPHTYDYDDMENFVSESIVLEYIIKRLMKETSLGQGVVQNLVRRGQNIRA